MPVVISKAGKRWRWKYIDPSTNKSLGVSPSGWSQLKGAADSYERMANLICADRLGTKWSMITFQWALIVALVCCILLG